VHVLCIAVLVSWWLWFCCVGIKFVGVLIDVSGLSVETGQFWWSFRFVKENATCKFRCQGKSIDSPFPPHFGEFSGSLCSGLTIFCCDCVSFIENVKYDMWNWSSIPVDLQSVVAVFESLQAIGKFVQLEVVSSCAWGSFHRLCDMAMRGVVVEQ
jgi:hypothetical protein